MIGLFVFPEQNYYLCLKFFSDDPNSMIINEISGQLSLRSSQVSGALRLFEQGCSIPFIARYRKEATESLDELQLEQIWQLHERLKEREKRKVAVIQSIREQGSLTPELEQEILRAATLAEVEDLYLPYKPKRRTKAQIAIERGLEPLAKIIMSQKSDGIAGIAKSHVKGEIGTAEEAIEGAKNIIAEWVSENSFARRTIRRMFEREAVLQSKLIKTKEAEAQNFKDYFDYSVPLRKVRSHTLLAIRRGEEQGFLRVDISIDVDSALDRLDDIFLKNSSEAAEMVQDAITDSYKRLIKPSIENEFAALSKEKADREAIEMFSENLRQLLLSPPLGQKRILAIDPGFRTGCKVVTLDEQGNLLHNTTIYPHPPHGKWSEAQRKISALVESYKTEAIAIGNGTAGRETENLIKSIRFRDEVQVFVVNESGASIYSASKIAREEFPDYDVTVRGAVSLGRRLIDPLAELVKIDPKSIGVGQYQHDVNQKQLKESLDFVVASCVNSVGVNLNTASQYLLTYVSGIGEALAKNIVDYRKEHGAFASREALKSVPRFGEKAFQLSAGFLRVENSDNPLDNTAVHPESYHIVEQMAKDLGLTTTELIADKEAIRTIDIQRYVSKDVGIPTLKDIVEELYKPTRDPRKKIEVFEFDRNISKISDLRVGMVLPGIVTNLTKFGAFVDIGIHENGLIHISQITDRFISDPSEVLKLNQQLMAKVIEIDQKRKRISLSLRDL